MADHPNAELVRRGYDAFIAGDMEWLNEHLHENVVWHEPGNNFLSGDVRGRDEVLAHFAIDRRLEGINPNGVLAPHLAGAKHVEADPPDHGWSATRRGSRWRPCPFGSGATRTLPRWGSSS